MTRFADYAYIYYDLMQYHIYIYIYNCTISSDKHDVFYFFRSLIILRIILYHNKIRISNYDANDSVLLLLTYMHINKCVNPEFVITFTVFVLVLFIHNHSHH